MSKGRKDLPGFQVHPENINRKGRPKKLVSWINEELKKQGYSPLTKGQMEEALALLLNLPITKIREIATLNKEKSRGYAALYKIAAKGLLSKRGEEYMLDLMNRIFGSAPTNVSITSPLIVVGDEETKRLLTKLEKNSENSNN